MSTLAHDVKGALRQMRRKPGTAALVILTLGTAIGLATSLFSIYNTFYLRAWPVKDPARVVRVTDVQPRGARGFSLSEWRHLSSQATTLTGITAADLGFIGPFEGRRVFYEFVSASYFPVLGIGIHPGRAFGVAEDAGEPRLDAVISHDLWQGHFGGDADIVGRTAIIRRGGYQDEYRVTVVGVASPAFHGTSLMRIDVWLPVSAKALFAHPKIAATYQSDPRTCCWDAAARLAPGVSRAQAAAELQALSHAFRASHGMANANVRLGDAAHLAAGARGLARSFVLAFVAVGLVLALACANAGNILLAHAHSRRREIAVRLALGASPGRLTRQLLTESLALAAAAAVVGIGTTFVIPRLVMSATPGAHLPFQPDHRVVAFSLVIAVLACLAAALPPALQAARATVGTALRGGSGTIGSRWSLREGLLAAQVALCVLLLVNAAMLARAVPLAMTRGLDLDPDRTSITHVELPPDSDAGRWRSFGRQLVDEVEAPQYAGRAAASALDPLQGVGNMPWGLPGQGTLARTAVVHHVSSGFFDVLKAPLVAGRKLLPSDPPGRVAVVNEALARTAWPEGNPIGKSLVVHRDTVEVVGVVRDAEVAETDGVPMAIYRPLEPEMVRFLLVRDVGTGLAARLSTVATRVDSEARLATTSLASRLDGRTRPLRIGVSLAGMLGIVALVLATFGLFGVFARAVHERTREIGVRVAIGARPVHVFRAVFSTTGRAVALGLGAGTLMALVAGWLLRHSLYGLGAFDPVAYAGVGLLLTLAGAAATYVPTRRALNVDPAIILRCE